MELSRIDTLGLPTKHSVEQDLELTRQTLVLSLQPAVLFDESEIPPLEIIEPSLQSLHELDEFFVDHAALLAGESSPFNDDSKDFFHREMGAGESVEDRLPQAARADR